MSTTALRDAPSATRRRTITLRRRCRSMPTYCWLCSTGVSFRRFRFGLDNPSVLCTSGSGWRREDSRWDFFVGGIDLATLRAATRQSFVLGARPGAHTGAHHAGAALRSFITSIGAFCLPDDPRSGASAAFDSQMIPRGPVDSHDNQTGANETTAASRRWR